MFQRILYAPWVALFPLIAFVTAVIVYSCLTSRALRMRPTQVERLARLPLDLNEQPAARHEPS